MSLSSQKPGQPDISGQEDISSVPKPQKRRWLLALTAISCTRAFASLLSNKGLHPKSDPPLLHSNSHIAIYVQPNKEDDDSSGEENDLPLPNIDQKTLTDMVKEKNLELLSQLGGVKELATILEMSGSEDELLRSKNVFGANNIHRKPPAAKDFLCFVAEAFKNPTILIFLVCAILTLLFGVKLNGLKNGWYDGGSIMFSVLFVVVVTVVSNFNQSRQLQKLSAGDRTCVKIAVCRDGQFRPISIFDIVVGDRVCLKIGDQVPADGLLYEGYSLRVDESMMTGESDQIEINDGNNPFLLTGAKVTDGHGLMLVTSVGINTAWGEMMSSISRDLDKLTPLQTRLNKLTWYIGKVGLAADLLVFVVYVIHYFTGNGGPKHGDVMNTVVTIVAAVTTTVVVAIPEGMPLAVILCSLAYSMKKVMMNDNVLVRKFSACETMGFATTVICTDKTASASFVDACRAAGVDIKMITGDDVDTATAIASECGILKPYIEDLENHEAVVQGEQFRSYSTEEIMEKADKILVIARSTPPDKLLMVQCLKRKGHVIAFTGEGTSDDALALKEADVGISKGIQISNEVEKEGSDIIILDGNFTSLVEVIRWGRCVRLNTQKFLQFQLTISAALVFNFVAAVSSSKVPLTAFQLLWVNLIIMNTLGALALATEQPSNQLMEKQPVARKAPLITRSMWRNLIAQALYQVTILLTLEFKGRSIFGVDEKVNNTLIFNTFVLCQVFNEFNAREMEKKNIFKGLLKNKVFLGTIGTTIILQFVMVECLKRFASTERLDWVQWSACLGIAALSWLIGWLAKYIPVSE